MAKNKSIYKDAEIRISSDEYQYTLRTRLPGHKSFKLLGHYPTVKMMLRDYRDFSARMSLEKPTTLKKIEKAILKANDKIGSLIAKLNHTYELE